MEDLKFIGKKYSTEDEKQKILESYDKYQIAKLRYINSQTVNDETMSAYWSRYTRFNIAEKVHGKDLKDFTHEDIENTLKKCTDIDKRTLAAIRSFGKKYCEYCISQGDIKSNPFNGIKNDIVGDIDYYKSKIIGMNKFYDICNEILSNKDSIFVKQLLLARYGILGTEAKFMLNLRYSDIDINNKIVNIINDDGKKFIVPIDNRFIELLKELNKEADKNILESDKYVLTNSYNMIEYATIYTRVNTAFESIKQDRISFNKLLFTRQLEFLLNKRKERKLTKRDVKEASEVFKDNSSTTDNDFLDSYEMLTGDKIVRYEKQKKADLTDPNSKEFAENKARELDLSIDDFDRYNDFIDAEDSYYQNEVAKASQNNTDDISNHKYESKEKENSKSNGSTNSYKRDAKTGLLALKLANFQCELNKEHKTFVSNSTSENYVEAHHIIPMKYYDDFEKSIDNEANIVALCPTCHRQLHYGKFEDKKGLLIELYEKNIHNLFDAGLDTKIDGTKFDEDDLIDMYKNC